MWRPPLLALPLLCVALAAESAVLTPLSQTREVSADTVVSCMMSPGSNSRACGGSSVMPRGAIRSGAENVGSSPGIVGVTS